MAKKALGKGLGAIISTSVTPVEDMEKVLVEESDRIVHLDTTRVIPNPDQPRLHFDEAAIEELAESIRSAGLLQPIIVRKQDDLYVVVAGERRLRAVKHLGQSTIKSIVIEADEEQNLTMALIENIQRVNLDPIEEAKAFRILINRFKLRQQDIAARVGKDRATVANLLRLLTLPEEIQQAITDGRISMGHAKVILSVPDDTRQMRLFRDTVDRGLSVRGLEKMIADAGANSAAKASETRREKQAHIRQMEEKLVSILGTKVEIKHSGNKGKIEISYYSLDDFERIVEKFA